MARSGNVHIATLALLFSTARTQINPNPAAISPTPTTSAGTTNAGASTTPTASQASGTSTTPLTQLSTSSTNPATRVSASSTTLTRSLFRTAIVPVYLYDAVDSLLNDFPLTRPTNTAALSWPHRLVIGTVTYDLQTGPTESPAQSSRSTSSLDTTQHGRTSSKQQPSQNKDSTLGIILGVVIGTVSLAVMAVLFWCLARRRKRTGYWMRRSTPSTSSTTSGRLGAFGMAARTAGHTSKRRNMSGLHHDEPALLHPVAHRQSSRSTSEANPFHAPLERPSASLNPYELEGMRVQQPELDQHKSVHRKSTSSVRDARPPTPFSPAMMWQTREGSQQQPLPNQTAPSLPNDREADYVVSPISPSKSFEREKSSVIHYPSMDEVNDFDFAGKGKSRASVDGKRSWHRTRERTDGRYEMA